MDTQKNTPETQWTFVDRLDSFLDQRVAELGLQRELLARVCEASLLSATVAAQLAGLDSLVDPLAALHFKACNLRRDLEDEAEP